MQVAGQVIDGNQFVFLIRHDARDVFLQFVVMLGSDEILAAFNGEYDMDINLRIGIGHAQKMPPLAGLGNLFWEFLLQRCRPYGPGQRTLRWFEDDMDGMDQA
jgi:hypothetical protein